MEETKRVCPEHKTEVGFPRTFIDEVPQCKVHFCATMDVTGVVLRMADISKAPTKLPRAGLRVGHL
jgi:hypothetical protein